MRDPILHAGIADCLPDDHPLAFTDIDCVACDVSVHAANNETMCAWIETGLGPYCLACFAGADVVGEPHYITFALPDEVDHA